MGVMNRTNIYLSEPQLVQLKQIASKLDISVSELIRRIIDQYLSV